MGLMTKQGYKQTEVGLIPEDWSVKKFDEFGRFFKGKGIKKDEVRYEGNPCVRYGELYTKYDNVIKETFSFISNEIAEQSIKLKRGDLLFAGSGETKEDIGKSAVIMRDDTYCGGDIVVFRAKNIDSVFLGFMSNSIPVSKQKAVNGQGDAVVHIYAGGISKIQIPVPSTLTEQKAIATALSDVDALITSLEQTITKKKAIKQGAMQHLLTGNTKLKGFKGSEKFMQTEVGLIPEDWEVVEINDVIEFSGGSQPPKSTFIFNEKKGYIRLLQIRDYKSDKYITFIPENLAQKKCSTDDIMIGRYGPPIFQILKGIEGAYNVALLKAIPKKIDKIYAYYFLKQEKLFDFVEKLSQRSSGQTGVDLNQLKQYKFGIPTSIKEQKAIATALSDMDTEIEQLQTKKAKYQAIKQGMMQELLTGKTRLI